MYIDPYGLGRFRDFVNWLFHVICYIVPGVGEGVGACEAAPDGVRICVLRHEWNEEAREDMHGDDLYPGL